MLRGITREAREAVRTMQAGLRTAKSRQAREQARGTVRQQREQWQAARGMLAQRAGAPAVAPPAVADAKVERTRQGPRMLR